MSSSIKLFIFPLFFIIFSYISLKIFRDYPSSMDEYNYVYQAKIFAKGDLKFKLPQEVLNLNLNEIYMIKTKEGIFSKFPPFFSVVLAPFTYIDLTGIVNPLLSTLSLLILYLILKKVFDETTAFVSAILVGTNLYFLGYTGSYYAQPLSLFFSLLLILQFINYRSCAKKKHLSQISIVLALHILTRPLDGLIVSLFLGSICLFLIQKTKDRFNLIVALVIGIIVGANALMFYNYLQAGIFKLTVINTWHKEFRIDLGDISGLSYISALANSYIHNLKTYFIKIFFKYYLNLIGPIVIILSAVGIYFKSIWGKVGFLLIILFLMIYNFSPNTGWPQYGARYWYPIWAGTGLLIANGISHLFRYLQNRKLAITFVLIMIAIQSYFSVNGLKKYEKRFEIIFSMRDFVEKVCPPKTIVPIKYFIETYRQLPQFISFGEFKRNPFLSGERLYTHSLNDAQKINKFFKEFKVCKPY